jgi:hypothetical protein
LESPFRCGTITRKKIESDQRARAEKQESDRRARDGYGKLYPMDIDIWKYIGQNPKIERAFLDDKEGAVYGKMSDEDRGHFDAACQMMGDMFEYYMLIAPDLKGVIWADRNNCWDAYMKMITCNSKGYQAFIASSKLEWTHAFIDQFNKIKR